MVSAVNVMTGVANVMVGAVNVMTGVANVMVGGTVLTYAHQRHTHVTLTPPAMIMY